MGLVKQVAFLHNYLALGGSDKVTAMTSRMVADQGIHSTLFTQRWVEEEFPLPHPTKTKIEILSNNKKLFAPENVSHIIDKIKEYQIKFLFICVPIKSIPKALKEQKSCKLVFWDHSMPMWHYIGYRQVAQDKRRRSLLNRLQWYCWDMFKFEYPAWSKLRAKRRYQQTFEQVDHYIVLCDAYKEELSQLLNLNKEEQEKIICVQNPIELREEPKLEKKKEIVYLGRLTINIKGVDRLLKIWQKCFAELADWELKIYGSGDKHEQKLRKMAEDLGLERCHFCGFTADTDKVYDDASILCLTSTVESWGLVLTEAQNNGVVPLSFDVSAGVRLIMDGDAGILVPKFDLDTYAEELKNLCLNEELRQRLQKTCLEKRLQYRQSCQDSVWQELLRE